MTSINGTNSEQVSLNGIITDDTTSSYINLSNDNLILQSGNGIIQLLSDIDLNTNNIINTDKIITSSLETLKINDISPNGGVFMTTSDCTTVNILNTPLNLIQGGSSIGSLNVPANTFTRSSYSLYVAGSITTNNNNDLLIRLLSNGSVLLGSIDVLNVPSLTARPYTLKVVFTIRSTGSSSSVVTSSEFTYNQNSYLGNHDLDTATINTTIANVLFLTIQSTSSTTSSQFVRQCILTKIY